jgi:hypothetical protein
MVLTVQAFSLAGSILAQGVDMFCAFFVATTPHGNLSVTGMTDA